MKLREFSKNLGAFYRQEGIDEKIKSLDKLLSEVLSFFFFEYDKVDETEFAALKCKRPF